MEVKLLTLMLPFRRKFKHSFSISESNTEEAKIPEGSEKEQTFSSECCSVIAVFVFQIFLQQEILQLCNMVHVEFYDKSQQLRSCTY